VSRRLVFFLKVDNIHHMIELNYSSLMNILMATTPLTPPGHTHTRSRARTKPVSLLKAPQIAYPTIALGALAFLGWAGLILSTIMFELPLWLCTVVGGALAFACFTPMHDASHKSITRTSWPNEVIGRLCALPLLGPFAAFRYLHLSHHRHTNEHEHDPDMWSGRGPWYVLPLRWLTQDFHYYAFYLAHIKERPRKEAVETIGTLLFYVIALTTLAAMGHGWEALFCWFLPGRIGLMLLAFAFDYLPHRPHQTPSKVDRFEATVVRPVWWLTPLFLYQNYHLIHHLYPGVPFYRYAGVWQERKAKLLKQGAQVYNAWQTRQHPE
jgi:beta-carotene hydroxylase